MKRMYTLIVAVMVAVAMIGVAPAVLAGTHSGDEQANETVDVQPGEQLSGVVGVQDVEFEGEIDDRAYGIKIANATSEEERAEIVADRHAQVEERVGELEDRLTNLEDARESGEISEGEYRAEVAKIAAEKGNAERAAVQNGAVAENISDDVLEEQGINVSAINALKENASELTGPEVAEIAQSIAGENVGQAMAEDAQDRAPVDTGPDSTPTADDDEEGEDDGDDEVGQDVDDTPGEDAGEAESN